MDILNDNVKKIYKKFLIPSLGSAMVLSVYTLTDAIVIGKGVGSLGLAGLNVTTPLLCILMALGILFGIGGSVKMNVFRGINEPKKANNLFSISFFVLLIVTMLIWILYNTLLNPLLKVMGADDSLIGYSREYMRVINIFLPFAVFSNFFAIFVRADNDPNRAMLAVICGGILNIILDIVLVFPLGLGMKGAAIASATGMVCQVLILLTHFFSKKNEIKLIRPFDIARNSLLVILTGIPSFFNELANGFIVFIFNIQVLKYCGSDALSIYSVIANCVILFNSLFTGVGQSIQPAISNNYGAGKFQRIESIKKMGLKTVIIMGIIISCIGIIFPVQVSSIFLDMNEELEKIARYAVRLYFIAFLPLGINLYISYYLQAILEAKKSLLISVLRNVVLSSIGLLVLPLIFNSNVLWVTIPIIEFLVLILSLYFLFKSKSYFNKVNI